MKINKPSWGWKHDPASGWSFKVGNPHLSPRVILGRARTRVDGEYTLHVFAAQWRIIGKGQHVVSSRSPKQSIDTAFAGLNGIQLISIELNKDGWVHRASFDEDILLEIKPLSWAGKDNVANWIKCT